MSAEFTRRRLLALAAAAGVGAVGWRLADGGADSPEERLTAVLGERDAARSVGRRYLAGHPDERDERALLRLLMPLGDPATLTQERVRRVVRSDFVAGRVVLVDGWYLSQTEARLCALATFV